MPNNKHLLTSFLKLVSIESPLGSEGAIHSFVVKKLSGLGLSVTRDRKGNMLARSSSKQFSELPLFLSAHLDTVQPIQGIQPVVHNGYIFTRSQTVLGADNKAAVAAIIEALRCLRKERKKYNVEIVFTVEEEIGNQGARSLNYTKLRSRRGFCFDSARPVGTVISSAPYYNRIDMEILGKSSHASRPEDGVNALTILGKALAKIDLGKVDEETTVNFGRIEGGDVRNTVPEKITLLGEVRSFSVKKLEVNTRKIIECFRVSAGSMGGRVQVKKMRENNGYAFSTQDDFIKTILTTVEELGLPSHFTPTWGCADNCIFLEHGIRVVNLGYGAKNIHTTRERIAVAELARLTALVTALVKKFAPVLKE